MPARKCRRCNKVRAHYPSYPWACKVCKNAMQVELNQAHHRAVRKLIKRHWDEFQRLYGFELGMRDR